MKSGPQSDYNYLLKYILAGDSAVGKSQLLFQFVEGIFKEPLQQTIGIDFGEINFQINNKIFRIQIWDTSGLENFRSITRLYFSNSACDFLVYDISNRESFNNVSGWIEDCKNISSKTTLFVLIGNKTDLNYRREVSFEEGSHLAKKIK